MEVIIDGIRYVPENVAGVRVHDITYDSVAHWLYNIQADLIRKWIGTAEEGKPPSTEIPEWCRIHEFEDFCEKYLGFREKEGYGFEECNPLYIDVPTF